LQELVFEGTKLNDLPSNPKIVFMNFLIFSISCSTTTY